MNVKSNYLLSHIVLFFYNNEAVHQVKLNGKGCHIEDRKDASELFLIRFTSVFKGMTMYFRISVVMLH